jgi:comEA protein
MKEILRMRRAFWNGISALAVAAALVVSPAALAASKKTPTPAADASDTKADKTAKVNLNTADEKDLAAAKGVGAKLAKALVAGRPYKTWDEVSKVKGVGSGKKLDALKKVLKVTDGVAAKVDTATAGGATTGGASASGKAAASTETSSTSKKSSSSEKLAPGTKININTASAEELDKLPEIGPVKAKAIVDYREANGKFAAPEDIMKVSGIKEGTFAKIKDFIVVK